MVTEDLVPLDLSQGKSQSITGYYPAYLDLAQVVSELLWLHVAKINSTQELEPYNPA